MTEMRIRCMGGRGGGGAEEEEEEKEEEEQEEKEERRAYEKVGSCKQVSNMNYFSVSIVS
jgi:hypothetical protein